MVIRERYLKEIRPYYDSDLVKVLYGIRRSGKSVILDQIRKEIGKKSDNVIYLNLELDEDYYEVSTTKELAEYVNGRRKEGKCYLFLDEVQRIEGWETAVKDFRLHDISVFVTGSNSSLLSEDLYELLSGRFIPFRIRPFVYREIVELVGEKASVDDYLVWGGFPGHFDETTGERGSEKYLRMIFDTVVQKDAIRRHRIKEEETFRGFVNFIVRNNAREYSLRSIERSIASQKIDISVNTVSVYLGYLKSAFLVEEIPYFSNKAKSQLIHGGKLYDADVSFNSLLAKGGIYDIDHNMENIVYNELLFRGYELDCFKGEDYEIDFLARKEGREYLVQVCHSLVDPKCREREFKGFSKLDSSRAKVIISDDRVDFSTSTVRHIKLSDFLTMEDF